MSVHLWRRLDPCSTDVRSLSLAKVIAVKTILIQFMNWTKIFSGEKRPRDWNSTLERNWCFILHKNWPLSESLSLFVPSIVNNVSTKKLLYKKVQLLCMGSEPGAAAEWYALTIPLSYGGHLISTKLAPAWIRTLVLWRRKQMLYLTTLPQPFALIWINSNRLHPTLTRSLVQILSPQKRGHSIKAPRPIVV